jgi:hypothetical protein
MQLLKIPRFQLQILDYKTAPFILQGILFLSVSLRWIGVLLNPMDELNQRVIGPPFLVIFDEPIGHE